MKAVRSVLFFIIVLLLTGPAYADVVIIANKNIAETTLSKANMTEIYLGKRVKWGDNSRIKIAISGDKELHKDFLKACVGRSASQFKMHWRNMAFTGQGKLPKALGSDQEVIDLVSSTSGAMGYVSKQPESADVKTITIN